MDPIAKFSEWFNERKQNTTDALPSACCLSTLGTDGFPNARFVSLKAVMNDTFIVTGPMDSRKGMELTQTPKAALTFWWDDMQQQIRIQGTTSFIESAAADHWFDERNTAAKIVSTLSKQGEVLDDLDAFEQAVNKQLEESKEMSIQRPKYWGGIALDPMRIEFMEFRETRLHHRTLFTKTGDTWQQVGLQP